MLCTCTRPAFSLSETPKSYYQCDSILTTCQRALRTTPLSEAERREESKLRAISSKSSSSSLYSPAFLGSSTILGAFEFSTTLNQDLASFRQLTQADTEPVKITPNWYRLHVESEAIVVRVAVVHVVGG